MTASEVVPGATNSGSGLAGQYPNFFLAGQPKTGTTALHAMLRQHPDIYMPEFKEPHFFATDLYETERHNHVHPRTLEDYLSLFARASPGQAVGEASTHYLRSHVAAANLHAFNPDARVVVMLREPASLLRSLHLELVRLRYEPVKDLRRALALETERKEGRALPPSSWWPQDFERREILQYSEHVRYVDQLQRFRKFFPEGQVMVLIYDDYRRDNRGVIRQVLQFLGVDDGFDVGVRDVYTSSSLRFEAVLDAIHWVLTYSGPLAQGLRRTLRAMTPRGLPAALYTYLTGAPPPPVDQGLMAELRHLYAPEVLRLSEYLGRDLVSLWGGSAERGDRQG